MTEFYDDDDNCCGVGKGLRGAGGSGMRAEAADLFSKICARTWAPNNLREKQSFRAIPGSQVTPDEAARAFQEAGAVLGKQRPGLRVWASCNLTWLWVE